MSKPVEERIVEAIIRDLSDRRGIGDEWDQIDAETREEIRATWGKKIRIILASDEPR